MHIIPYVLPSPTFTAGGTDRISLRALPSTLFGRIAHLVGIHFQLEITNTGGTVDVTEHNNVVSRMTVSDGTLTRFRGSFNTLRMTEWQSKGHNRQADPDDATTTTLAHLHRTWFCGPPEFAGGSDFGGSDFVIPCALLNQTGEVQLEFGALTDLDASTTAATVTIRVTALLCLLDEVRIPPAFHIDTFAAGVADIYLPGNAVYTHLAMADSLAYAAIGADEFGNVTLNFGQGDITGRAAPLFNAHSALKGSGSLADINGQPETATDDSVKRVNTGTPTAIAAAPSLYNPILLVTPGAKISKCPRAENTLRLRWDGGQASAGVVYGRILEQTPPVVASIASKVFNALGKSPGAARIKTLSKEDYKGPFAGYLPWKIAV